jgi:hypothetical protein
MRDESGSNHGCAAAILAALALAGAGAGCEAGTGGAVELSWKLRPNSSELGDKFVDCERGGDEPADRHPVKWIQLNWNVTGANVAPGTGSGKEAFHCDDNHGVTGFALPVGTASLWVTPTCNDQPYADPAASSTFIAPAPVIREVKAGQTISLNAVELVITVFPGCTTDQPCICQ